ncbi:hypothetical protein A1122_00890 [Yersinia pestis A1122]|nr:hypothetical protein A1122_00890 [Yersinia pestis A1122]EKS47418.1 hypothetical protein INS_04251 [Yersinia pestis INS]ERP76730.1 hypothetical protein L327_04030 [Yersinia pestis S3]ERP77206.1 hypothetical protein L328_04030 [Yersinia pestis 24H]ERP78063.1 hypothetical protein L326_04015 [Yersinia pestis 113]ERP83901.1 hypothetical protein L325_03985 [Yersinia pestis 9]
MISFTKLRFIGFLFAKTYAYIFIISVAVRLSNNVTMGILDQKHPLKIKRIK